MLTTECSKPSAKNVMMGSHMAVIFSDGRLRDHRQHCPDGHHPITENGFHHGRAPATVAERRIGQCFLLRSLLQKIGDRAAIARSPVG